MTSQFALAGVWRLVRDQKCDDLMCFASLGDRTDKPRTKRAKIHAIRWPTAAMVPGLAVQRLQLQSCRPSHLLMLPTANGRKRLPHYHPHNESWLTANVSCSGARHQSAQTKHQLSAAVQALVTLGELARNPPWAKPTAAQCGRSDTARQRTKSQAVPTACSKGGDNCMRGRVRSYQVLK